MSEQLETDDYVMKLVDPRDLIPYEQNSKIHSDDAITELADSMVGVGFNRSVSVSPEGGILAGHKSVLASIKNIERGHDSFKSIPVLVPKNRTDDQKKAFVLAENRQNEKSPFDFDIVSSELKSLQEADFDIDLTGFDTSFILEEPDEGLTDEDATPEIPEEPVTVLGDIWVMGEHRLMCGDSTVEQNVSDLMNGMLADQLLTDPPYNVAYEGKTKDSLTIQNDSMSDESFRQFLSDAFINANMHMKAGAVFYIWHADSEGYNFRGACHDTSWKVRQCLIWKKQTIVMGRQDYHWKHEPCLYGWKDGSAHLWASDRKQSTILEFDRPSRNAEHPTMKPVELFEYQVLNNTKGNDLVLDIFGGSGTTLIACEKNNRKSANMEFDAKYCDVIVARWQEYTGKQAVLESTGQTFDEMKTERLGAAA